MCCWSGHWLRWFMLKLEANGWQAWWTGRRWCKALSIPSSWLMFPTRTQGVSPLARFLMFVAITYPTLGRVSSSSEFPAISLGLTTLGEIFAYVIVFNPTTEEVTFRLCGWWMLGVFLLPAFARLGHECQDLLSPCDGRHACTDLTPVYSLTRKSFREWRQNPC